MEKERGLLMYLSNSSAEYMPAIALLSIFIIFSSLAIIEVIKRDRLRKKLFNESKVKVGEYENKILAYYSYECYLIDYYMRFRETSTAALHRDYARAIRRALVYAGVPKEVIAEYEKRKVVRL